MNLEQFILIVFLNLSKSEISIPFIRGSAFGYLAAIAIPVAIPNRNIFLAFNFEANYALPWNETQNDLLLKWALDGNSNSEKNQNNPVNMRNKRTIYNRNNFYKGILAYIQRYEKNSLACLQRLICETTQSSLHTNNGIVGSIFKILFMPSTSTLEKSILHKYYEAEEAGKIGNCYLFSNYCTTSFLDLLSI